MIRLIALAAVAIFTPVASAAFIAIDTFNDPTPFVTYPITNLGTTTVPAQVTGSGSTRNLTLNVTAGTATFKLFATPGFDPFYNDGVLSIDSSFGTRSSAILLYNALTGTLGNFFASGIPLFLNFTFQNLNPGLDLSNNGPAADMPLDVAISTTGGTFTGSLTLTTAPTTTTFKLPFTSLSGFGDLSQVLSLTVTLNGGVNQREAPDFVLSEITLETFPTPVPPTVLLALGGVPFLAVLRRRF